MSDGRCIHCGQKGHYSMMCPKKPNFSYSTVKYSTDQDLDNGSKTRTLNLGTKKQRFSIVISLGAAR